MPGLKSPNPTEQHCRRLLSLSTGPGRFAASYVAATTGTHKIRLRARGRTLEGQLFEREQSFTAVVFSGGDAPPPTIEGDPLCDLLECLVDSGFITTKLARELESKGINVKQLLRCLEQRCRPQQDLGGEQPYTAGAGSSRPVDLSQFVQRSELIDAALELQRQSALATTPQTFAELEEAEPIPQPEIEPMIENFGIDLKARKPKKGSGTRRKPNTSG